MSPFRESGPEGEIDYEHDVKEWYQDMLASFVRHGFELTPAEAVYLRQLIKECIEQNRKEDPLDNKSGFDNVDILLEVVERFFWNYYGINFEESFINVKSKDKKQVEEDLFRYIQEKLRKDREMI